MNQHAAPLFPTPPSGLQRLTFRSALGFIGPGVIIASVTIGSGELVWASRSGAIFGTAVLWSFLFAGIFKGVQVYASTRYMALTGEHPMAAWNDTALLKWWFAGLCIALPTFFVMPLSFSGISEAIGFYLIRLLEAGTDGAAVGLWTRHEFMGNVAAGLMLTGCLLLSVATGLKTLEHISAVILGILLICVMVAVVVINPDLMDILAGLVPRGMPDFEPWVLERYADTIGNNSKWGELALYLTAVGGGTYDYIGYVGLLRDKQWGLAGRRVATRRELEQAFASDGTQLARARGWIRAPFLDTTVSFTLVTLVTLLFAVLGSLVLYPMQEVPSGSDLLNRQEGFLTLLHPQLTWIYRGGVLLAFVGTLYGAFEIYRHTMTETVRAFVPRLTSAAWLRRWRWLMNGYCFIGGMTLIWLPEAISGNIADRMILGAVVGGALTCGLWCFAMLIIDRVRLPKALRMGPVLWTSVCLAGTVLTFLGGLSLFDYFAS